MRFDRLLLAAVFVVACDSRQSDSSPQPVPEPNDAKVGPKGAPQRATDGTGETIQPTPQLADIGDDDWCDEAHGDAVKLVSAMKEAMAGNGKEADGDQYTVPDRATYVELCEELPPAMQKCLVLAYARQNKEGCQRAREDLDASAEEIYGELMGQ